MKHDKNQENKHQILRRVCATCLACMVVAMTVQNFSFVKALSSDENASTEFVSDETNVETDTEFTSKFDITSSDASNASDLDDNVSDEELLPDESKTADTSNNDVSEVSDDSVNDNTDDATFDDENLSSLYAILYRSGELHFSYQNVTSNDILQVYDVPDVCDSETEVPWYQNRLDIKSVTSDDIVLPGDTSYWFYDCKNLVNLDMSNFDMKNVTEMRHMFDGCNALQQVSIGENFKFIGDDSFLPRIDGKEWKNPSGNSFTSDSIPCNQSDVYKSETVKYQVAFDANEGTGTMSNQVFDYDVSDALTTNTFTRKGYVFTGWNTKPDGNGVSYDDEQTVQSLIDTSDVLTLYAMWKPITCTIQYDSNQGFGLMLDTKLVYGKNDVIPKNVFLRDGYAFTGWYASRNHDGVTEWLRKDAWQDDDTFDKDLLSDGDHMDFAYDDKDVVTLHAVWTPVVSEDNSKILSDMMTNDKDEETLMDAVADDNEVNDEKLDVKDNSYLSESILDEVTNSDETSDDTLMSKLSEYAEASVTNTNDDDITNDSSFTTYNSVVPTSADTNVDAMWLFVLFDGIAALFMLVVLYQKSLHE